jgi:hypothetical protein
LGPVQCRKSIAPILPRKCWVIIEAVVHVLGKLCVLLPICENRQKICCQKQPKTGGQKTVDFTHE